MVGVVPCKPHNCSHELTVQLLRQIKILLALLRRLLFLHDFVLRRLFFGLLLFFSLARTTGIVFLLARISHLQLLAGVVVSPPSHVKVGIGADSAERQGHPRAYVREVAQNKCTFARVSAIGQDELFDIVEAFVVMKRWRAASVARLEPTVNGMRRPL